MKILIAEDDPTSALFLSRTLARRGYETQVVGDGAAAWEALEAGSIPILISDWMMPRLNGLELCRKIRARSAGDYTYVILLTSKDCRDDRLEGLRAGADDFLTKPLDPDELAVRLEIAARILAVHDTLARQNAKLAELASIDELTGVKNRRRLFEDLDMYLALWARHGTALSLVMLDVDHFKQFNDTFGHPAGDEVLRALAGLLTATTRSQDVVARYGGEEFVVLLPKTAADGALMLAERLRERVERMSWPLRSVRISLGVATTGPRTSDRAALIEAADRALYQSKREGRNRVTHYRQVEAVGPASLAGSTADR